MASRKRKAGARKGRSKRKAKGSRKARRSGASRTVRIVVDSATGSARAARRPHRRVVF